MDAVESKCPEIVLQKAVAVKANLPVGHVSITGPDITNETTLTQSKVPFPSIQNGGKSGHGSHPAILLRMAHACRTWSFNWEPRYKHTSYHFQVSSRCTMSSSMHD